MRQNLITGGALGWAILIFLLSSQPASRFDGIDDTIPIPDFVVHMGLYFVLAGLVHAALRLYLPKRKNFLAMDTVIFSLLYGVSDEFHQSFVPGRTATAIDLLADVLGAIIAVTLWLAYSTIRNRRSGQGPDAETDTERT